MDNEIIGIKELSLTEMKKIDGGIGFSLIIALIGVAVYLYDNREDLVEGFKEGYAAVRKDIKNYNY
jgi:hypothetical protein